MKLIPMTAALLIAAGPSFAAECTKKISDQRQSVYAEMVASLTAEKPVLAEQYAKDIQEKQIVWMAEAPSSCAWIERLIQDLETNYLNK